jgi:hypothetical protein
MELSKGTDENVQEKAEPVKTKLELAKEHKLQMEQDTALKQRIKDTKDFYKRENEMLTLVVENLRLNCLHYEYSQKMEVYRQRIEEANKQVEGPGESNLTLVEAPKMVDLQGNPIGK